MLTTMYAALVSCTVALEPDDTYFAVCKGRKDLAYDVVREKVEFGRLGGYCTPYKYEETEDSVTFVVVCE